MPVHPVKQHQTNTLANLVTAYAQKNGAEFVFRAHNRLDRNTSGLVLIAKDKYSVFQLHQAVRKVYFALVHGRLEGRGTITTSLFSAVTTTLLSCWCSKQERRIRSAVI